MGEREQHPIQDAIDERAHLKIDGDSERALLKRQIRVLERNRDSIQDEGARAVLQAQIDIKIAELTTLEQKLASLN